MVFSHDILSVWATGKNNFKLKKRENGSLVRQENTKEVKEKGLSRMEKINMDSKRRTFG